MYIVALLIFRVNVVRVNFEHAWTGIFSYSYVYTFIPFKRNVIIILKDGAGVSKAAPYRNMEDISGSSKGSEVSTSSIISAMWDKSYMFLEYVYPIISKIKYLNNYKINFAQKLHN